MMLNLFIEIYTYQWKLSIKSPTMFSSNNRQGLLNNIPQIFTTYCAIYFVHFIGLFYYETNWCFDLNKFMGSH